MFQQGFKLDQMALGLRRIVLNSAVSRASSCKDDGGGITVQSAAAFVAASS